MILLYHLFLNPNLVYDKLHFIAVFFLPCCFSSPQDQSELNSTVIRSPTNTVVIRGLKPGSIYVFQVRARTVAGFGRYSGKLYFQTMTEGENSASVQPGTQSRYHLPCVAHRHAMQHSMDTNSCGK